MVHSSDKAHRGHERLPGVPLARQHAPALGGEPVETASSALAGFLDPPSLQPAALLETVEQGIERGDVELQLAVRQSLDLFAG